MKSGKLHYIILTGCALLVYTLCFFVFDMELSQEAMFGSVDANGYLEVADWIYDGESTPYTEIRPFLYPALLGLSLKIGGVYLLWGIHVLLWIGTSLLVFHAIKQLVKRILFAYLGAFLIIFNFSLISLTFYGLSELLTVFLLALFSHFIVTNREDRLSWKFLFGIVTILAMLTVTRPVFYLPLIAFLIVSAPWFFKLFQKNIALILVLPLTLMPIVLQYGIVKTEHDKWTLSTRSQETIDYYFLAQGLMEIESIEFFEAKKRISMMTREEKNSLLKDNAGLFIENFGENLAANLGASSELIIDRNGKAVLGAQSWMDAYNKSFRFVHFLFLLLGLILFVILILRKRFHALGIFCILSGLNLYLILSTGVSFWQGDRLALPVVISALIYYPFVLSEFSAIYRKKGTLNILENSVTSTPQNTNMAAQTLSIIIPAYNEEATIHLILDKVRDVVLRDNIQKELIIVNDCSKDDTKGAVERYMKANPELPITYYEHEVNKGKGAALHTGIEKAKGDYLIIQDADLEYDPEEYNDLLKPIVIGQADVVYGSRFMGSNPHRILFYWHSRGNKFLTNLSNMFTNLNLTDMETCYKLFKTEIIQGIPLREKRFGFEPEVTAKISRIKKIRIYEVGISYYGRTYEEGKKIGWKDGFRAIYCILKYGLFRAK